MPTRCQRDGIQEMDSVAPLEIIATPGGGGCPEVSGAIKRLDTMYRSVS